jgi:hypothetical protein
MHNRSCGLALEAIGEIGTLEIALSKTRTLGRKPRFGYRRPIASHLEDR